MQLPKKPLILAAILILATGTIVYSRNVSAEAGANPYTSSCPGNKIKFGIPKGKTATSAARSKVFGRPYPNANVQKTDFFGKDVYVNKKIVPCLKATEWDLKYKYKTKYQVKQIWGASEVNSQNPYNYFHAYGGAVDINPSENPQCNKKCKHKMPKSWVRAFNSHGFFWGGNFKNDKDYMHFEWHGQK